MIRKAFAAVALCMCLLTDCMHAQGQQEKSTSAFTGHYDSGNIKYRVWIPAGVVPRGIVFASMGNNWDYRHFVDNPAWQAAARHWQFMLVGTGPKGARQCEPARLQQDIETLLAQVARDTGHAAVPRLPFCAYGFSYGGLFTRNLAGAWPERMIAGGIGGMTLTGHDSEAKEKIMPDAAVKENPFMITVGELDHRAAEHWQKFLPLLRKAGFRIALAYQWGLSQDQFVKKVPSGPRPPFHSPKVAVESGLKGRV